MASCFLLALVAACGLGWAPGERGTMMLEIARQEYSRNILFAIFVAPALAMIPAVPS